MQLYEIRLTKKQLEILKPVLDDIYEATNRGKPGVALLQIGNDLKHAHGCFVPQPYALELTAAMGKAEKSTAKRIKSE